MELEKDGMLPFHDTKLTRREGRAFDIAVYRKQVHTDRYLECPTTEEESAEGRGAPHRYFQTKYCGISVHPLYICHA